MESKSTKRTNPSSEKNKIFRVFSSLTVFVALTSIGLYGLMRFTTVDDWISLFGHLPGSYKIEDTNRDLFQLIESRGFHYERHFVNTPDGYILQLVRLVNPYSKNKQGNLKPVLLHHGLQCSATAWLVARDGRLDEKGNYFEFDVDGRQVKEPVGNSLGFVLASRGYDVWLVNYRGNIYSTNHTTIDTNSAEFWRFSMDEMIKYDLPAEIDYILAKTGRSTLSYIGHSQGSMMPLILMSKDDRYARLIRPFIALSPVFNLKNADSSMRHMRHVEPWLFRKYSGPIPGIRNLEIFLGNLFSNRYLRKIFLFFTNGVVGMQEQNLILDRVPVYAANLMMGSSSGNIAQILQFFKRSGPATYFDYGPEKNQQLYGQPEPPEHDVSKINSTHMAFFYTAEDTFCHLDNIKYLKQQIKVPLLEDYQIPDRNWNHMDLVWAKNVGHLVNEKILHLLSRY